MRHLPLAAIWFVASSALAQPAAPPTVGAELRNLNGVLVGRINVTAGPRGVLVRVVSATGFSKGWHSLSFHERGDCSGTAFAGAGEVIHDGRGAPIHGLLNPASNETGELPNIFVPASGAAVGEFYSTMLRLAALRDADGSSVIIELEPDDHRGHPRRSEPHHRVACAVIPPGP